MLFLIFAVCFAHEIHVKYSQLYWVSVTQYMNVFSQWT